MDDKAQEPEDQIDPAAEASDPDQDLKAKYREALAHKHASAGAADTSHGDSGTTAHAQTTGPTQRMFRRKSGG